MIKNRENLYITLLVIFFVISTINLYFTYNVNSSYEKLNYLENKIDSLSIVIEIREKEILKLENTIENQKTEIREITITKYIRPPFNSSDSSYKYLKAFLK